MCTLVEKDTRGMEIRKHLNEAIAIPLYLFSALCLLTQLGASSGIFHT